MEKKIEKVLRFIELSKKFSKSEYEVVPKEGEEKFSATLIGTMSTGNLGYSSYSIGNAIGMNVCLEGRELYIEKDGTVKAKDQKTVTRVDSIKAMAEAKVKLLEEYWEFLKLQFELQEYFTALKKINE